MFGACNYSLFYISGMNAMLYYIMCAGYINHWARSTVYRLMATIYYAKYQSTIAVAFD